MMFDLYFNYNPIKTLPRASVDGEDDSSVLLSNLETNGGTNGTTKVYVFE